MTTEPFPIERDTTGPTAGVVTVRVEQAGKPVVVLDHDLIRRIEATLKAVPADAAGLVFASASERVFIAGADLKSISEWDDDQLHRYLEYGARVFGMLANFRFPTVAAINGAALGGGLEIAMHCDGLVAAPSPSGKPYPVGLPEAGLAICPGWGGTNLLPARIDPAEAIRRTASGTPMTYDEAVSAGLFDRVVSSAAELIPAAKQWIVDQRTMRTARLERDGAPLRWIGRPDRAAAATRAIDEVRADLPQTGAGAAVAEAVDAGLARGWQAALQTERDHLVRLRHTPPARAALEAFFNKSRK